MLLDARSLVDAAAEATRLHRLAWDALVPDRFTVNPAAEAAEEDAYAEMVCAKQALRDHVRATYGITAEELARLTQP
jgi:hypothetical protein